MKNKNTRGIDDMKIQEKMRKPMLEAKYLNVENTDRYRPIIRLFYLKYEKLKYWMYQEEVFEELKKILIFRNIRWNSVSRIWRRLHPGEI
jgi:hypothetical protein